MKSEYIDVPYGISMGKILPLFNKIITSMNQPTGICETNTRVV